jgi:hypothetical protein
MLRPHCYAHATDLFTMMAASSMMQLAPITMGPAMAKMVAFGCTIVPVNIVHHV